MKNTKTTPVSEKDWEEINSIIAGRRCVHMGDLSREKLDKIGFLLEETENYGLIDSLHAERKSFGGYLRRKYPLLSDNSYRALETRARFMDR